MKAAQHPASGAVRRKAASVTYVDQKAPHLYRCGGRQNVFVKVGDSTVQLASCGTHEHALTARAERVLVTARLRGKGAK